MREFKLNLKNVLNRSTNFRIKKRNKGAAFIRLCIIETLELLGVDLSSYSQDSIKELVFYFGLVTYPQDIISHKNYLVPNKFTIWEVRDLSKRLWMAFNKITLDNMKLITNNQFLAPLFLRYIDNKDVQQNEKYNKTI